jgi:hypothetical protein
MSLSGT